MIDEEGTVIKKLGNGRIQIVVKRSEACQSCSSKSACTMLVESKEMLVEAHDEVGAEVGQRVVLAQAPAILLKASFTVYILPILGLLAGVFAGKKLSGAYSVNPDLLMPLLGLLGAGLVYFFISRKSFDPSYLPTAVRIIPPS